MAILFGTPNRQGARAELRLKFPTRTGGKAANYRVRSTVFVRPGLRDATNAQAMALRQCFKSHSQFCFDRHYFPRMLCIVTRLASPQAAFSVERQADFSTQAIHRPMFSFR